MLKTRATTNGPRTRVPLLLCAAPTAPRRALPPRAASAAHRDRACHRRLARPATVTAVAKSAVNGDVSVVVLGAGIIGLSTALALLRESGARRVALVEKEPAICSGSATGAGQGYIWLAHRAAAASPLWHLAQRSKTMWELDELRGDVQHLSPAAVEWQANGSLLLASSEEESAGLCQRQDLLSQAGLDAQLLSAAQAMQLEPALRLGAAGSALLVPSDAQARGGMAFPTAAVQSRALLQPALLHADERQGRRYSAAPSMPRLRAALYSDIWRCSGMFAVRLPGQSARGAIADGQVRLLPDKCAGSCTVCAALSGCGVGCLQDHPCRGGRDCGAGRVDRPLLG